ncbi:site-specific integrase [Methylorubrum sp. Q1]|nr:site-specific integrase [Methylorubrum sp. Q1]
MRQFPHLKRNHRSGNWVYFRRFPVAAQATTGQTFFERSLRTADKRRLFEPWNAAHCEFETIVAKAALSPGAIDASPSRRSRPLLNELWEVPRWDGNLESTKLPLALQIERVREAVANSGTRQRYERAQRLLNDPSMRDDDANFRAECDLVGACGRPRAWLIHSPQLQALTSDILSDAGLSVPAWHATLFSVERMVEAELRSVLEAEERWRMYDFSDMPSTAPAIAGNVTLAPNGQPFVTLDELVQRYAAATRKPIKTVSKLRMVARYIQELHGGRTEINSINKNLLVELQTKAFTVPARLSREERSLTFPEIVERAKCIDERRSRLTPQAIRSWFNLLGGCFNWAVATDLLERNPTTGIKPKSNPLTIRLREAFNHDDLISLFSSEKSCGPHEPEKYWIPLIGLYTGARLNEIGQLMRSDIDIGVIPHLRITDQTDIAGATKRLKNASSRRIVPIHPNLITLGFLDYVRGESSYRLFPKLPHDGIYEPTKAYSQWFGRHLRSIGIVSKGKVFHSLRHTFKDACRKAGIEEEVHDALTGHSNLRNVGRSYGSKIPLSLLAAAVKKIDYGLQHKKFSQRTEQ